MADDNATTADASFTRSEGMAARVRRARRFARVRSTRPMPSRPIPTRPLFVPWPPPMNRHAVALCLLSVLFAAPASAREYSVEIDVDDEEDLRELYEDGQIEDDELERLLALLESPIDLNYAEREDLFELPQVPADLAQAIVEERVRNGPFLALTDLESRVPGVSWQLLSALDAFVLVRAPAGTKPGVRGHLDFLMLKEFEPAAPITNASPATGKSLQQLGYDRWPAFGLGGGVSVRNWLNVGLYGIAQESVKAVRFDPATRDLHLAWGTPTFRPYLGFLSVRRPEGYAVVGSYHVRYGLGLVMATLSGNRRHGPFERQTFLRGLDRIGAFDGLLGGAGRLLSLRAGRFDIDLSFFASIRSYDLSSSFLGLAGGEVLDPVYAEVESPRTWLDGQRVLYTTIPDVFRVGLVGGNASVRFNRRTHVGLTGYAAHKDDLAVRGVEDHHTFLLRSRWPAQNDWGAVGVNAALGVGIIDMAAEFALSFGREPGLGVLFRAELEPAWGEIVFSARHYDLAFDNPYARAEAAADTLAGLRARNEDGLRLVVTAQPGKRIRASARVDLSRNIRYDLFDLEVGGRFRGDPTEFLGLEIGASARNQDLAHNGRQHTYSGSIEYEDLGLTESGDELDDEEFVLDEDALDEGIDHAGERYQAFGGFAVFHKKAGSLSGRYTFEQRDNGKLFPVSDDQCTVRFQRGHRFRVGGRFHPHRSTTIGASLFYNDDDLDGDRGGSGSWGPRAARVSLVFDQKIKEAVTLRLRGAVGRRLPDEPSLCDEGTDGAPALQIDYQPTEYDLRTFAHLSFQLRVRF